MSFSGSGISFGGLSSGIDSDAIIQRVIQLQNQPIDRLRIQQIQLKTKQAAYDQYNSLLNSLRTAASDLNTSNSFSPIAAASSDETVATVTADSSAAAGIYKIFVSKLAQAHKTGSAAHSTTTGALNYTGSFTVNGKQVDVIATDSLATIAGKINNSGAEVTASLINGGAGAAYLTITANKSGAANAVTLANVSGTALASLNFSTLIAAQDAAFTIDGIATTFTSETNEVTGVIPGATVKLLKADLTTPPSTTITLTRDTTAIKGKVNSMITAYNAVVDYLKSAASFDSQTLESGPLFSDSTVELVQNQMFSAILNSPSGITGTYKNLLAIGIDFDSAGKIMLDGTKFDAAVLADIDNVRELFAEAGTITDSNISFVSATNRTKVSGLIGYNINISQIATQAATTAGTAFTDPSVSQEVITFGGNLLGGSTYGLTVAAGATIDSLITSINNDSKLKDIVSATKTGNNLVLTSKKYGSAGNFTVKSSLAAAADNSGIGTTLISPTGLNVAGTINGEAATGSGQFLTGNSGNTNTDGLQLVIRGGALGDRGTMVYSQGGAAGMKYALDGALDFVTGYIKSSSTTLQTQIEDIDTRITNMNSAVGRQVEILRAKFNQMEEAMTRLRSQQAQLNSMLSGLSS